MVNVAYKKINTFGVERYYILSNMEIEAKEVREVNELILKISQEHGCQVIINGLYTTLNYYLRLISSPSEFIDKFVSLVEKDSELMAVHKRYIEEQLKKLN